jgi:hypothetical protein
MVFTPESFILKNVYFFIELRMTEVKTHGVFLLKQIGNDYFMKNDDVV